MIILTKLRPNLCFGGYTSVSSLQKFTWKGCSKRIMWEKTGFNSHRRSQNFNFLSLSDAPADGFNITSISYYPIYLVSCNAMAWIHFIGHPSCRVPKAQEMSALLYAPAPPQIHLFIFSPLLSSSQIKVLVANFGPQDVLDDEGLKSFWITLTDFILCVLCRWRRQWGAPTCMTSTLPGWSEWHLPWMKFNKEA